MITNAVTNPASKPNIRRVPSERLIISSTSHLEKCLSILGSSLQSHPPHPSPSLTSPQPHRPADYHMSLPSPVASEFPICPCSCSFVFFSPPPAVPSTPVSAFSVPPCPSSTFPKDSVDSLPYSPLFSALLPSPPASFPLLASPHAVPSTRYPNSVAGCWGAATYACGHQPK